MAVSSQREHGTDVSQMVVAASELEAEGQRLEAIDTLTAANRIRPDAALESRLVHLRHRAFEQVQGSPEPSTWPAFPPVQLPDAEGLPIASPDELTPSTLRARILEHGCLLVRGLVPQPHVDRLVKGIDRALAAYDARAEGAPLSETRPWYEPFKPKENGSSSGKMGVRRNAVRAGGAVLTADSPRMMYELLDTLDEVGLRRLTAGYLGERPALSMNKCTLRRAPLDAVFADWHQDGAFLGDGIRTVNVWLSLSHCGRDAPGLDILPRRLDRIVETGTEGAIFPWAVAPDMVERTARGTPICRPMFEPGDVLLFDELFLHRTACDSEMTRERYAIETWLFAPSAYPDNQIPLVF
jgi:Phytanoyl-CoA dioxygenase (PhyH)